MGGIINLPNTDVGPKRGTGWDMFLVILASAKSKKGITINAWYLCLDRNEPLSAVWVQKRILWDGMWHTPLQTHKSLLLLCTLLFSPPRHVTIFLSYSHTSDKWKESRSESLHISGKWTNNMSRGKHLWNHRSVDLLCVHSVLMVKPQRSMAPALLLVKELPSWQEIANGTPCPAAFRGWGYRLALHTQYHNHCSRQSVLQHKINRAR